MRIQKFSLEDLKKGRVSLDVEEASPDESGRAFGACSIEDLLVRQEKEREALLSCMQEIETILAGLSYESYSRSLRRLFQGFQKRRQSILDQMERERTLLFPMMRKNRAYHPETVDLIQHSDKKSRETEEERRALQERMVLLDKEEGEEFRELSPLLERFFVLDAAYQSRELELLFPAYLEEVIEGR